MSDARTDAFDAFLDAIETDEAYYLTCPAGHGSIPPRRICPDCHSRELVRESLPTTGEIETFSIVSVPAPRFSDASPYVTAIADFGPVNVTGQVHGIDPAAVEVGQVVTLTVETTDDQRVVSFRPA